MKDHLKLYFIFMLFACSTSIHAQVIKSNTNGLGIQLNGKFRAWSAKADYLRSAYKESPTGISGGAELGFGFANKVYLSLNYDLGTQNLNKIWETLSLHTYGLTARYFFNGTLDALRPYVLLGADGIYTRFKYVYLTDSDGNVIRERIDEESYGYSIKGGLGVKYFITPKLNIDLMGTYHHGRLTELYYDEEPQDILSKLDTKIFSIGIGVGYMIF